MQTTDWYAVLGVPPDATAAEIKQAYRRIASETHPDRTNNNPLLVPRFQRATAAYRVLGHPAARRIYDQSLAPITSVSDLFLRNPEGRGVMQTMLPRAPAAAQRGEDVVLGIAVSPDILTDGGMVTAPLAHHPEGVIIRVPPGARNRPWCHLPGRGEPGINGGPHGDAYLLLTEVNEPVSSRGHGRRKK